MRTVLPEAITRVMDWDSLELMPGSLVSAELRSRYTDLLFRARLVGAEAFVFVLVEHQSRVDRLMAFRMLEYVVGIWSRYLRDHDNTQVLPPVIPVVVHTGRDGRAWTATTEIADLIEMDPVSRAALESFMPRMRFLLDDVAALEPSALLARPVNPMVRVMLVLQRIANGNTHLGAELEPLLADLAAILDSPEGLRDFLCVVTYIVSVGDTDAAELEMVFEQLGPVAKETMMTTAERLEARGEARGKAEVLLELLAMKFAPLPDGIAETVRNATPAQVSTWTGRLLDSTDLAEVFAP